jgi:hypothetical protein
MDSSESVPNFGARALESFAFEGSRTSATLLLAVAGMLAEGRSSFCAPFVSTGGDVLGAVLASVPLVAWVPGERLLTTAGACAGVLSGRLVVKLVFFVGLLDS